MRRELNSLELAGIQALEAQLHAAQQALSRALAELGFKGNVRNEGNVLTDEEPDAQPGSSDE